MSSSIHTENGFLLMTPYGGSLVHIRPTPLHRNSNGITFTPCVFLDQCIFIVYISFANVSGQIQEK